MSFIIPADDYAGMDMLTEITFDLTLTEPDNPENTYGTVPVRVRTSMDLTHLQ